MAEYIPYQPVYFSEEPATCVNDELPYKQLVDTTDTTQFQMSISACDDAEDVVLNGDFENGDDWTLGDNWTITGGQLCLSEDSVSNIAVNDYEFDPDKYYEITITVDSISTGGGLEVYLGSQLIGTITTAGTHTFYGFPVTLSTTLLEFHPTIDGMEICISLVEGYEVLTNNIVGIYTEDGTLVTSISYQDNPDYFEYVQDTVTVNIEWAELEIDPGCYYLCWMDACENTNGQNYPADIENCSFGDGLTRWDHSAGSYWSSSGGNAVGDHPGGPANQEDTELTQTGIFFSLVNQCVDIVISAISGTLEVYFGDVLVAEITTIGTHTVCGTPDEDSITLTLTSGCEVTVASVCPHPVTEYTCNLTSNIFKLGDYSDNCTLLINLCNDDTSMGFDFSEAQFTPRIRVEGKLRQSSYKGERSRYVDSKGKHIINYFDGKKFKTLVTEQQPEYVHDFLRLLIGADRFYINGIEHYCEDEEYTVIRDSSQDEMGSVSLLVGQNNQNVKNTNCSSAENDCNLSDSFLLLEEDPSFFLVQESGGGKFIING